jgi:hypothetical protein
MPEGDFCVIDANDEIATCVPILKLPSPNTPGTELPISMLNGYIALPPETWTSFQVYIKDLQLKALNK